MKELQYPFDGAYILKNKKRLRRELLEDGSSRVRKNIAVLGGSTTSDIVKCLELFLLDCGIEPCFYESEYAQFWQDAVFENERLSAFSPDIIFIHTSGRNISVPQAEMTASAQEIDEAFEAEVGRFRVMWESLKKRYSCPIIQNNFEMPYYRLLGNRDISDIHGKSRLVARLNAAFADYAAAHDGFFINDICYLSACRGLEEWSDPFYWMMYKYALCVPAIPEFSFNLSNIIKSIFGKNKKVVALDLDNTLWGGVVGDDGVGGIEIGQETSMGQVFTDFQGYLKSLKKLGIPLAVCSKNDEENALAGLRHPDGLLSPEDFAIIKANWEPKDANIRAIADELGILTEGIVFVDDNPAERDIVARQTNAAVPEVTKPEEYIRVIDRSGFFEMTSFSEDDARRSEMYRENAERSRLEASYASYEEYLLGLEMRATITGFEPIAQERITQLTNKSNQFNLTTKRCTLDEIRAAAENPDYICLCGRLADRFGDNGIVSVVMARLEGRVAHIELWLMSCRVLKRDMELAMLDSLVKRASARGITELHGYYYPTAKNAMVRGLYESFGFEKLSDEEWLLKTEGYKNKNKVITTEEKD